MTPFPAPAIAVFIYRRRELAEQLAQSIRPWSPRKVWIIADGPKNQADSSGVEECRQRVEKLICWDCEVRRVYSPSNLGLRKRIETGLDAVFAEDQEAILLEEDCHPNQDFFPFCEEMLARYRNEDGIGGISGNCFLPRSTRLSTDYFFSRYLHIWGWATWARAWKSYDRTRWSWPSGGLRSFFPAASRSEEVYWNRIFSRVASGRIDTWDYRWLSHLWSQKRVSITPRENLIQNRGFGPEATHTVDSTVEIGIERNGRCPPPYRGPQKIQADEGLDHLVFQNHFLRTEGRRSLWQKIRDRLAASLVGGQKTEARLGAGFRGQELEDGN